jgi:hypothetical protein
MQGGVIMNTIVTSSIEDTEKQLISWHKLPHLDYTLLNKAKEVFTLPKSVPSQV